MTIAGTAGYAGHDRYAIVPSGVDHSYFAQEPNQLIVVDLVAPPGATIGGDCFAATTLTVRAATGLLLAEARSGGLNDSLVADTLARYLLAALNRSGGVERRAASPTGRRLARLAEEYLRARYVQPLTVSDVAAAVGTSPSHLHRCFRAHTGQSVVAFIHQLRLEQAAALLRETDLSVLEVANAVGFASQSHLSRLFNRRFGCAPGRYRASI